MAFRLTLLWLNPFGFRVDREGWWFQLSVSWLRVCLSVEGAKNVSWPWLSPLQGWGSLTIAFNGKFVYIYIYIYIYLHKMLSLSLYVYIFIHICVCVCVCVKYTYIYI